MERSCSGTRLGSLNLFERKLRLLLWFCSWLERGYSSTVYFILGISTTGFWCQGSLTEMNSTQWKYCSSTSRRHDYHALRGKWVCTSLDFPRKGGETKAHHWPVSKKEQLSSWLSQLLSTVKSLSSLTLRLKQANRHGNCVAQPSEKIVQGAPSAIFFEGSGKKCRSLYRGLRYIKVRYIEVPLH